MPLIQQRELSEVLPQLSNISPFDAADAGKGQVSDAAFLCALGFEDRCLTLPRALAKTGYRSVRVVCFTYSTNSEDNEINRPALQKALETISPRVEYINVDETDFSERLRTILQSLPVQTDSGCADVTFDISVTANRVLLRSLKVLLRQDVRLRILYAEAEVYHPTLEVFDNEEDLDKEKVPESADQDWTEWGVGSVLPSSDYPGETLDNLPDAIILFPSFKPERSRAVVSFVDPSLFATPGGKVFWLLGRPHAQSDEWRIDAMTNLNKIAPDAPQHVVSTFDYKDTMRVLESLHGAMARSHKLSVSPLGSKMQALGLGLFCYLHPDVRVILTVPLEYNAAHYSEGCKATWKIDLGKTSEIRELLASVGTIRVVE